MCCRASGWSWRRCFRDDHPSGARRTTPGIPSKFSSKLKIKSRRSTMTTAGVEGITGRDLRVLVHQPSRGIEDLRGHRDDHGEDPTDQVVDLPTLRPAPDGPAAVEDLLEDFGVDGGLHLTRGSSATAAS